MEMVATTKATPKENLLTVKQVGGEGNFQQETTYWSLFHIPVQLFKNWLQVVLETKAIQLFLLFWEELYLD